MQKILKKEEKNRKKKEHIQYSDSYIVKFWIKDGEFWKQKEEMYFAKDKGSHDAVFDRWKKDYVGTEVTFISVTYQ